MRREALWERLLVSGGNAKGYLQCPDRMPRAVAKCPYVTSRNEDRLERERIRQGSLSQYLTLFLSQLLSQIVTPKLEQCRGTI